MYESQLINGLIRQEHNTTLTQLVVWSDTSIWKMLFEKVRKWTLSEEEVTRKLDKKRKEVLIECNYDHSRIAAKLIHHLSEAADVTINGFYSKEGLHKIGKEIEESALNKLKKQTKGDFTGTSLQDMIKYKVKQMLEQLEDEFEKKSLSEKKKITTQLLKVIDELSEEEIEKIKKELGVNQLSENAVRKAITTGAFSVAIASAINLGGFGSYLFAVKALAAVTGLIGVTLPFGVYTALTSWMAALSNPFLIIPATIGFAWLMTSRGNRKIKESMLPQFTVQIALAAQKREKHLEASNISSKL